MKSKAGLESVAVDGLRIESSHPCLAGHFPGNPIVPAVILLDEVLAAIRSQLPGFKAGAVTAAKFLSPLLPEEPFSIRLDVTGLDVHFECRAADRVLARGSMRSVEDTREEFWEE